MAKIFFPWRPRPDDPRAAIVVQRNVEHLGSEVDKLKAGFGTGSTSIPFGDSSKVVTHNLDLASNTVMLTPTKDPTVRYWVSAVTKDGFTISLSAAAPVGGADFDWLVKED